MHMIIKAIYRGVNACVKVNGKLSDSFDIRVRVRQGSWMFNIFYCRLDAGMLR